MPSPLSYAFLSTAPAADDSSFAPVLRSSLAHRHREHGARLEQRDGWLVPVSYPGEDGRFAAAVADVSHVGKLEVRSTAEPKDGAIHASVRVGPDHHVVLCRYADLAGLGQRLAGTSELVVDRTSSWCALLLAGPARATLLRRVSPLESVPGRGPVGKVPGTILDRPSGYWLLFSQEFAQYGWDLALDLAGPLGGGAVGVGAVAADDPLLAG